MQTVRVAALQFAAGMDVAANKKKILEMIDRAAAQKPDLMVLPEFCNHASWYQDADHCYQVSLSLDDPFFKEVGNKAKAYQTYICLNVTLQRPQHRCTGSSLLFDRKGQILAVSDKQVLMGHENDFLMKATQVTPVIETEIGRIGLYACMDGVIPETPRDLALRGAQILCNSLNSFAVDEASLHVPVRAAENKVFVVAANKVGSLIPEDQLAMVSQFTQIPQHFLYGAGESQIVAPDGSVLVKASLANEDIIFADIDPRQADKKSRPDGTSIFEHRRPELYQALAEQPRPIEYSKQSRKVQLGCWQAHSTGKDAILELCAELPVLAEKHELILLPELFFIENLQELDWGKALELSNFALAAIEQALSGLALHVAGSFLLEGKTGIQHCATLVNQSGIEFKQPQLHHSKRYEAQLELAQALQTIDLGFGKIGIIVGDDAFYPETFRLLALAGADLVLISGHLQERWEIETGLLERAAENRICLAMASRPQAVGASLAADLESDFTLMSTWTSRIFDGKINMPRIQLASRFPGLLSASLHLDRSHNKTISARTHLLDDRPWHLLASQSLPPITKTAIISE
ncbi:MAG: carbon-nitrogen hydrolase family protein [Proteobacteria bacterium]|nr:carbon-nitrogen hydrolase family protein [Pseudomonadota bacterium]